MYSDRRPMISLSQECWECFGLIKDVMYAASYSAFVTEYPQLVQQIIRTHAPDIQGDWLRFQINGFTATFSLCDEAITEYQPKIREFTSFAAAVRLLGHYESYVKTILKLSEARLPEITKRYKRKRNVSLPGHIVGGRCERGIGFFSELFGFKPRPEYQPTLNFFFELRNIAVHNMSIADERFCEAANNPYIRFEGNLNAGTPVPWNLVAFLQLHHLLTTLLPDADAAIASKLGLTASEKAPYWYLAK